jgi:glycosyltransferase involved in cell wall biosynthesis
MKIIFVCSEYPPLPHGGIGTFVYTLANGLRRKGHEICVVGLGQDQKHWTENGIEVFVLKSSSVPYFGNILSRLYLRTWLKDRAVRDRTDIIETPDFLGLLPFAVFVCPVVVRLHLSSTSIYLHRGQKPARGISIYEEMTLRMNSSWIAVSNYIFESTCDVFGIRPTKHRTIYNPVPLEGPPTKKIEGAPAKFILFAGQVSKRKGAIVLAEAARILMKSHSNLYLIYAGGAISGGDSTPITQQILTALGPEFGDRVQFLGHVDRSTVLQYMSLASVYVFPSRLEAFGLVILEAMSCGTPVVSTNYPPGPEIVTDGVDGLLADPTSPSDMAEKIDQIIKNPDLAHKLTVNAKQTIDARFALDKCVIATEAFYKECLSGWRLSSPSFFAQLFSTVFNKNRGKQPERQ